FSGSMSSPENDDPFEAESPEEQQRPVKTRYGRIIMPKGDLPGENEIPKIRKKKEKQVEPVRVKRKYTKRKDRTSENKEDHDTLNVLKVVKPAKEAKKVEATKEVKMEVEEEEFEEAEPEKGKESEGEDFTGRQVRVYRKGKPVIIPVPTALPVIANNKQHCELCGELMESYKLEKHKLDIHPEHAPYECLSCRVRSFFDYWDFKEHYRVCSHGRIATETRANIMIPESKNVIEAPFMIRLYQPVECPFCRIYVATFHDLDIHFNVHGLASMDAKFGCDGCRGTFVSVEALSRHLVGRNQWITMPRSRCFNTGRVLNRREIEKLKERYSDADRRDCMRKYNLDIYVLHAPRILERAVEAICAFCDKPTKAYAHLKKDLSNLSIYGLQCNEETEKEIVEKISMAREMNGRVSVCREHFQWKNWLTKDDEMRQTRQKEELAQKVIRRREGQVRRIVGNNVISVVNGTGLMGPRPSFRSDHCNGNAVQSNAQSKAIKVEEVEEQLYEAIFKKKEIKEEEPDYDEGINGGMDEDEEMDYDMSDHEGVPGETGATLPSFMDQDELEEKVSASMMLSYTCPVCQKSFPTMADIHSHQQEHPKSRLLYLCADCPNKSFLSPDDINIHFDEKKKSAVAAFYSFKVIVLAASPSNNN
ncbi:hypothetical protein PENTCL1PPCAC_2678, partial [Pristionchus entomophagus]